MVIVMWFFFKLILTFFIFISGFGIGFFGGEMGLNELRVQECLILDKKLQQYVYLQMDLSKPIQLRSHIQYPDKLDALGPVYCHILGITYEIDKGKFDYEPLRNNERYSLEVSISHGKKFVSPRSL